MAAVRFGIIARSMKTSAVQQQMVKPPLQVFGLEGRYASALYSAASKMKQLDTVEKDLRKFQQTLRTDVNLKEFLENPTLKRHVKRDALKQISSKLSLSVPTTNLFELMAENGRLKSLEAVINSFKAIMAAYRGEVSCEVVTATPLDAATKKELEDALKGHLKQGQTVVLNTKVDPAIIGGMIVSIGDKYVDMSTASKIKKYTDLITAAV